MESLKANILVRYFATRTHHRLIFCVDYVAEYLWKDCGNPPILFLDMRPVERVVGIVFSHSIAEQISRPSKGFKYGWHKVPGWSESNNIFGFTSIIRTNV